METQKTDLERWMELRERFEALVDELQEVDFEPEEIF